MNLPIDDLFERVEEAVRPYPKAAMFELAELGYGSPFEQLVGCILSIRTRDEVSLPVSIKLFEVARTPQEVADLPLDQLTELIGSVTFFGNKAKTIQAIAQTVVNEHNGRLPCDRDIIIGFKGVGPKCANLALGIACGEPVISVDIHVHRITNRWGLVETSTPEKTMEALMEVLPQRYWIDINRLLVAFGKHVCVGRRPFCSQCPLFDHCPKNGVKSHR